MNFEEALNEYLEYAKNRHKKQGFETISRNLKLKVLPYFKEFNVEDITKLDFVKWEDVILSFNYTNNFNSLLFSTFSGFLEFCCKYYNLSVNVAHEVGNFRKKQETDNRDFYTLEEFNRFIKCVDNEIYKQFFNLMFYCGTRPSEAMALKFNDIKEDYIIINKSIERRGNRAIGTPKNVSSNRNIYIDKRLKKDLFNLRNLYMDKFGFFEDNFFVFGGIKPLSTTTVDRYKLKACQSANLRPITQHQFRHSHASLLCSENVPISVISSRLGHSRISTTTDVYIHCNVEQQKRVSTTIDTLRNNFFETISRSLKKLFCILKHKFNMF